MSKRLEFIVFAIIIIVLVGWGEYIFPTKLEISDVQVVEVMGMDSGEDNKVSLSLLFEKSKGNGEKAEKDEKILTVASESFAGAEKGIRYYEDKIFIGSHVENVIIGEKLAQEDLVRAIEYIGKNGELRLDSNIYIAKESAASEIFKEGLGNEYVLTDRIKNICMTEVRGSEKKCVRIIDIVNLLLSDDKVGVIPCIQLVDNGGKQFENAEINMSEDEEKSLELAGYGVIKHAKLIGYLGSEESNGYDYIKNFVFEEDIKLVEGNDIIGLKLLDSDAKIKYDFLGDTLNKVVIEINTDNYIMETSSGKNIFAEDIKEIEELANRHIKDIVKATVKYAQNFNVDFIDIGKTLELKHPYKWRKLKDEWNNIFSTIPIEVEVNSKINQEYGVLSTTNKS